MSVQSAIKQMADAHADAIADLASAKLDVVRLETEVVSIGKAYEALKASLPPEFFNAAPVATKKAGRKGAKPKAHKSDFPKTDSAFWMSLITATPQKTAEILAAGAKKLGIANTDAEKLAVLKQRMPTNLQNLITDGKIKSDGERLNRTYFR